MSSQVPLENTSWTEEVLKSILSAAADHPILIGLVLIAILLSAAVHVVIVGTHVMLGLSHSLRRQFREVRELKYLVKHEFREWRRDASDFLRAETLPPDEVQARLEKSALDAEKTLQLVRALIADKTQQYEPPEEHKRSARESRG